MNNEIRLKNGTVVRLVDKDITGEQHMDVKKTYVATTKKEIVAKGIKYYQDKLNSVVMNKPEVESIDITPIMNVQPAEIPPVLEEITKNVPLYTDDPVKAEIESEQENLATLEQDTSNNVSTEEQLTPAPLENDPFFNTMNITLPSEELTNNVEPIPTLEPSTEQIHEETPITSAATEASFATPLLPNEELKVESNETLVEPLNFNITPEPVDPSPLPMLEEQEHPSTIPLVDEPFFDTMNITLPTEVLTNDVVSAPTPEPTIETPNPFTSINTEAATPTIEPISMEKQEPIVFDASKENNLLNALSDKNVETGNKAMLLNDDSLNNVRDFGGEQAKVNYQPNVRKAGFVNSKLLTVISILFFLASCGFLVYEIFNFINAKK